MTTTTSLFVGLILGFMIALILILVLALAGYIHGGNDDENNTL